jgi:hypothetical protein
MWHSNTKYTLLSIIDSLFDKEAGLVPMPEQHARYTRHPTALVLGGNKAGETTLLTASHLDRCQCVPNRSGSSSLSQEISAVLGIGITSGIV